MTNILLFLSTAFIWGTTWYAVKIQSASSVSPLCSISYRFLLASLVFFIICKIKKRSLGFALNQHLGFILQGISLFSLSYICVYYSSLYLISGILALISGGTIILNVINEKIWLKKSYSLWVSLGAALGVIGLLITVWSQIFLVHTRNSQHLYLGIVLGILSTYFASIGNILSVRNKRFQIPVLESNTFGMLYGGLLTAILAVLFKQKFSFDFHPAYIFSLSYLVLLGSVVAFQCFLSLVTTIGATRAGYVYIVAPLIAMTVSTFKEGMTWHVQSVLGLILVITGNILIMSTKTSTVTFKKPLKLEEEMNA